VPGKSKKKTETLRPDTTLAPVGEPEAEVYVRGLPGCCLRSFKEAAVKIGGERRLLELRCSCEAGLERDEQPRRPGFGTVRNARRTKSRRVLPGGVAGKAESAIGRTKGR
jgi:hypothetical protein